MFSYLIKKQTDVFIINRRYVYDKETNLDKACCVVSYRGGGVELNSEVRGPHDILAKLCGISLFPFYEKQLLQVCAQCTHFLYEQTLWPNMSHISSAFLHYLAMMCI